MPALFGEVLREAITRQGWSINHFAAKVGCAQGHVSGVISAKKRPSMTMAYRWADALKLTGRARLRFLMLAAGSHLPEESQAELAALVSRECSDK